MKDGQTFFHPSYRNQRQTNGQTAFYLIPHIGIYARQTDGETSRSVTGSNIGVMSDQWRVSLHIQNVKFGRGEPQIKGN